MYKKTGKFVLFTYLISWTMWGILALLTHYTSLKFSQPLGMILFVLGGLGPTFGAFLITNPQTDKEEYKKYIGQVLKTRVSLIWYLFILIVPFILFSIPYIINHSSLHIETSIFTVPVYMLLIYIPQNVLFGGLEELGWRGILLPGFMRKFSLALSTLFTSIIWSLWHLPLWLINGSPQENVNPIIFFVFGLCFSFLLSTLYVRTKSIFLCVITHSIFNSYSGIINMLFKNIYFELLIMLLFSTAIFIVFGKDRSNNMKENIGTVN